MQHSADTIWFPLIPILPQKYHTQSCHSNRILSSHISLRLAELPSLSHSRFWESPTQGIYMIVVTRHGVDLSKNRVYKISQGVYGGNLSRYGVNLWMFLGIIFRFDISLKVWSGSLKVFGKHFTEYVAFLSRCPIHALKVWCISQPIELILSRFPISLKVWGIAEHMIHLPGLEKTMSGLRRFSHGVLDNMIAWLTQTVNRLNKEPRVWWTKSCVNSKLFQSFVSCSCFKYQTSNKSCWIWSAQSRQIAWMDETTTIEEQHMLHQNSCVSLYVGKTWWLHTWHNDQNWYCQSCCALVRQKFKSESLDIPKHSQTHAN